MPDSTFWLNRAAKFSMKREDYASAENLYLIAWQKCDKDTTEAITILDGYLEALFYNNKLPKLYEEAQIHVDSIFAPIAYSRMAQAKAKIGDIEVAQIAIESGAVFNGKCNMSEGKISLEELSDYLAIEENKIMEWVEGGKIPVAGEGSKLLFDRKEVETWIARKP